MPLRPKPSNANKIVVVNWVTTVTCRVTPVNTAVVFVSYVCLVSWILTVQLDPDLKVYYISSN
jgi:hypothetical protein